MRAEPFDKLGTAPVEAQQNAHFDKLSAHSKSFSAHSKPQGA